LSFEPVSRLLGWQTQEEGKVLCATTIRRLVRTHGQILRQAEQAEVACAGWLGHPLAQRRHDHPKEAA